MEHLSRGRGGCSVPAIRAPIRFTPGDTEKTEDFMRKDRREEIMAQLEADRKKEKKKRGNRFCRIVSVIYTVLAAAFIALLLKLNALPEKYLYPAIGILAVASLFIVPVMFSKRGKKGRKIGATFVAFLLIGVFGVGTWYLTDTLNFMDHITKVKQETEDYYVVVPQEALYEDISGISGQTVGTYMINDTTYSEAKAKLQEKVAVEYAYEEDFQTLMQKLLDGSYPAVFVPAANYDLSKNAAGTDADAQNGGTDAVETQTKVLYTIALPIETEDQTSAVDVTKESFNVYISGSDMSGSIDITNRTDVNMIATVNPKTHEVLLTSIPRDYYVTLPSKNAQDKLTHSSLYGIQESIGAVENKLGIDINYYLRVNYSTIIKLVDAMGGIDINSEHDFYTSGMKGMPELNGHHFTKGINHVDGKLALAFCRERHSFLSGDMQRNENQQIVLTAILKKAMSSKTILTKYTALLDAVKDNMSTNMTADEMAAIIKMQLSSMPDWNIERQAIKGTNGYEFCYALGFKAATVDAIPEEEAKAVDAIVKAATGENTTENTTETESEIN